MAPRTGCSGCSGARAALSPLLALILVCCLLTAGCLGDFAGVDLSGIFRPAPTGGDGKLRVYFLDVGQGDSTLILFGNKTILVDAGEIGEGGRVINDLRMLGVTRIDLLVASHPHSDHIGGMEDVLAVFPVGRVFDTGFPHTSALYEKFLKTIDRKKIPYTVAEQGQTLDLDPALRITILSPPVQRLGDDLNENSIVLRLSYGTIDILMTGDAGTVAEAALLKTGYALESEILKAGHHGSSRSTGPAFLARVDPEVAVISVGAGNSYGHPHAETLSALLRAGVTVYRTDRDGTVLVTSDGSSYTVRTEKAVGSLIALAQPAGTAAVPTRTTTPSPSIPAVPQVSFTIPVIPIGNGSFIAISSTRFNAPGDDRFNLNGEWVQLENRGDDNVLLAGWTLSGRTGDTEYRFPPFILEPGRTVTVYTGSGNYNDTALFMGRTEPAWGNSGEIAILKDGGGRIIDQRSEG